MSLVIDSHHHFWDPDQGDYPWMAGDDMAIIRRPFWPDDLRPLLAEHGVDKTVLVQTWSSLDETRTFIDVAGKTDFVVGVVGWVDLTAPDLDATLSQLLQGEHGRYLVGVRHQVHDEPDPQWLLRDDVQRGLETVAKTGLVYDLLTRPRELPAALKTVQRFTDLRFVIDHISKPEIANNEIDNWRELIQPFGEQPNVWCKVSGMVTEADWHNWTPPDLKPYIDTVLEIFGPQRLLYGSDWPVSLLAAQYGEVKGALEQNIAALSQQEQAAIMGGNAVNAYKLDV